MRGVDRGEGARGGDWGGVPGSLQNTELEKMDIHPVPVGKTLGKGIRALSQKKTTTKSQGGKGGELSFGTLYIRAADPTEQRRPSQGTARSSTKTLDSGSQSFVALRTEKRKAEHSSEEEGKRTIIKTRKPQNPTSPRTILILNLKKRGNTPNYAMKGRRGLRIDAEGEVIRQLALGRCAVVEYFRYRNVCRVFEK